MTEGKSIGKGGSVAVIGSGYWGKNLVRNYHQLGVLKLICDKNETLLAQFGEQFPGVETCLALNDILRRDDISGVAVATPAETHFDLAAEILLAGKHLYVEKPLVLDEGEADELIRLAEERRLVLMVGHLLQYHPVFVKLKELASSGELGRINYIYSHRLNLGKIRREENILWSFAPHDISMILSLAGEEPESVLATGGNYLHRKIADVTTTHMEFPSGLRAHIFVSWLHPYKVQSLVVVGDRKMAVFNDTVPWEDKLHLYPHEIKWRNNMPVPTKGEPERVSVEQAEPLRLECEHFLECMRTGKQPQTDGREGLRVLRILNASQRSLDEGGRTIDLVTRGRRLGEEKYRPERAQPIEYRHASTSMDAPPGPSITRVSAIAARRLQEASEAQRGEATVQGRAAASHEGFFAHPSAVVDDGVSVGRDTKIWHFSHILSGSRIGERCNIGQNVVIGPDVVVGNGCKIQNNVSVYKGVTLEDDVFCGPSMVFTNVFNPRANIRRMDELRPTLIKRGATLGANCTIVCGVTIGRFAFVGAGAVVVRDVPDHALVVGNPARWIGWMCECGEKLDAQFRCAKCGKSVDLMGSEKSRLP